MRRGRNRFRIMIKDIPQKQRLYVMDSDRYSIRHAYIYDDVARRFITADEIIEE